MYVCTYDPYSNVTNTFHMYAYVCVFIHATLKCT